MTGSSDSTFVEGQTPPATRKGPARGKGAARRAAAEPPAAGLVIYAETGRSNSGAIPDTPAQSFDLGFRFPTADALVDVGVAAEYVLRGDVATSSDPGAPRSARVGSGGVNFDRAGGARSVFRHGRRRFRDPDLGAAEGLTFALRVASGAVSLSVVNPDRSARSLERVAGESIADSGRADSVARWLRVHAPIVVPDPDAWWANLSEPVRLRWFYRGTRERVEGDQSSLLDPSGREDRWWDSLDAAARASWAQRATVEGWWSSLGDDERKDWLRRGASAVGAVELSDRPVSSTRVTEWSRKSRSEMVKALSELDYSAILAPAQVPVMVTLTYPRCWLRVAATGREVKKHLAAFRRRFERRYGPLAALWKLEFQGRGECARCSCAVCAGRDDGRAPHIHLWLPSPQFRIVRRRGAAETVPESHREFCAWLSGAWADIVAHPDCDERERHRRAGTAVDHRDGLRGSDPKRLAVYFSKHGGAEGNSKEYQHLVPEAWRGPGDGPGRFWGYWRLERVAVSVTLSVDDFVQARRVMRRASRSVASYCASGRYPTSVHPNVVRRRVIRRRALHCRQTGPVTFDRLPGVVSMGGAVAVAVGGRCSVEPRESCRWVTRRARRFAGGGLVGGFMCVADGADFAIQVVQSLRPRASIPPGQRWW